MSDGQTAIPDEIVEKVADTIAGQLALNGIHFGPTAKYNHNWCERIARWALEDVWSDLAAALWPADPPHPNYWRERAYKAEAELAACRFRLVAMEQTASDFHDRLHTLEGLAAAISHRLMLGGHMSSSPEIQALRQELAKSGLGE